MSTLNTAFAVSVTRHMTAMPISTGLPRQSLIFWRELDRVMTLREIFLLAPISPVCLPLVASVASRDVFSPLSTSPLWERRVFAAGFTDTQKGLT